MALNRNPKSVWGWAIYDWANSAFATTVMAGFFPIFFKQYWSVGTDINTSTALLGLGNSAASLLVALCAPVLGVLADRGSIRKTFLVCLAYSGALATALLWTVPMGEWGWAIICYGLGMICFAGANVFYDALLVVVAPAPDRDRVSSLGYAMGYLGGGLLFVLNVLMVQQPQWFGLASSEQAVQYAFLSVALWWAVFTIFLIMWVHEEKSVLQPVRDFDFLKQGVLQLKNTVRRIFRLKSAGLFLLAYWCYMDGVDTIIRMAVDYGLSIGFTGKDLMLSLLVVQFVGFPSALIFGQLSRRWGSRNCIFIAIAGYAAATLWGTFMKQRMDFYFLAVVIGLFQGGIQALSRSYYTRFIPEGQSAEYFGLFNMMGKFSAVIGPALVGMVGLISRKILMPATPTPEQLQHVGQLASRWGIGSILVFFIAGALLLFASKKYDGKEPAMRPFNDDT
ncbi:MAG: MFS transporter [Desulfatirhabdiaceae bacterium]|nr:MFS transporter [Desulfatirhabdiaceae bacterium]